MRPYLIVFIGTGDGGRTRTGLLPRDFKSLVSANSTTPAKQASIIIQ